MGDILDDMWAGISPMEENGNRTNGALGAKLLVVEISSKKYDFNYITSRKGLHQYIRGLKPERKVLHPGLDSGINSKIRKRRCFAGHYSRVFLCSGNMTGVFSSFFKHSSDEALRYH
jgi:hypothetical protein